MFTRLRTLHTAIAALCVAFALVSGAHAQKWARLAPFPEPSEEIYGIAAGGKLYVIGGLAPGWQSRGLVYEYDPPADKWSKKKPMALPAHHVAFTEMNGKIYVMGGFVATKSGPPGWDPINNAWEYDPGNDSWKALAPLPMKLGAAVAAAVNGRIYAIGGAANHPGFPDRPLERPLPHRSLGTVYEYDPAANAWRERTPMPTARNHAAIGVVNGKIYVIGGRIGSVFMSMASNTDIVEEYDPATDRWGAIKAPMPTARSGGAWGTYRGRIYVAGGEVRNKQMSTTYRTLEAYDPASNSWTILPPMVYARHGLAGDVLANRLHFVSGDLASGGGPGARVSTEVHEVLELDSGGR